MPLGEEARRSHGVLRERPPLGRKPGLLSEDDGNSMASAGQLSAHTQVVALRAGRSPKAAGGYGGDVHSSIPRGCENRVVSVARNSFSPNRKRRTE